MGVKLSAAADSGGQLRDVGVFELIRYAEIAHMKAVAQRLFNVLTILCSLFVLLLLIMIVGGEVADWEEFIFYNFGSASLVYIVIVVANYVLFGKATLWHKRERY